MIIPNVRNFRGFSTKEVGERLSKVSGVFRMLMGCCNNCTYAIMMNALDKARAHELYKHNVKKAFHKVTDEWRAYERRLVSNADDSFFHIKKMTPEVRKKYAADITDSKYFEYWTGIGGAAYTLTQPEITSLKHKYKLSLRNHQVADDDLVSDIMVAMAALTLSCKIYDNELEYARVTTAIDPKVINAVFHVYSLERVMKAWRDALLTLSPCCMEYDLDDVEDKNIQWGLVQLENKWSDMRFVYQAQKKAIEDFPEVFRTKGEQKKELKSAKDLLDKYQERINKQQTT